MAKIIEFNPNYIPKNNGVRTATNQGQRVQVTRLNFQQEDSFQRSKKTAPKKGYSIEEMRALIGEEKADRIFSRIMGGDDAYGIISTPDGSQPLKVTLGEVWDFSEKAKLEREKKAKALGRTRRAFATFERECSKKHEELYGEKIDIRIKITKTNEFGEKEVYYLTDILKEQEEFYKKGRLMASVDLFKQRMGYLEHQREVNDYYEDMYDEYYDN